MKLDTDVVERRVQILRKKGVVFVTKADIGGQGKGTMNLGHLRAQNDEVLFAIGATNAGALPIPCRDLKGVYLAIEFLAAHTKSRFFNPPNKVPGRTLA